MTDKVAVITAGGSGMGAAAARRIAEEGCRVAILSSYERRDRRDGSIRTIDEKPRFLGFFVA
jgi:NAD(P)-dependent dehydrogenase (short-subunit alcohol dehydrogenase family)